MSVATPLTSPGKRPTYSARRSRCLNLDSSLTLRGSITALWSGVNRLPPELQDSVQDSRRRRTHVQGLDLPAPRQRDQLVAGVADAGTQPLALRAEDHHHA